MQYYTEGIRRIEKDKGIEITEFPELRLAALRIHAGPRELVPVRRESQIVR